MTPRTKLWSLIAALFLIGNLTPSWAFGGLVDWIALSYAAYLLYAVYPHLPTAEEYRHDQPK